MCCYDNAIERMPTPAAYLSPTIQLCSYGKYTCLILPMLLATSFIVFGISYLKEFNFGALLSLSINDAVQLQYSLPNEILMWLKSCQPAQIVLLDHEYLKYLHSPLPDHLKSGSLYRFAVIDSRNQQPKKSDVASSRAILNKIARKRYWYLYEAGSGNKILEPARAFLGLNLTSYRLDNQTDTDILIPTPLDFYLWQYPRSRFLECNHTAAEYVRKKYPKYYSEPPVLKDSFLEYLAYCRDLLLKYRLTPMITGGTALGWYRECGIIPHTTDTDIIFLATEWKPEVEEMLKSDPILKLSWILGLPEDGLELTLHVENSKIDINALYEEGNRTFVGAVNKDDRRKLRWWYPPFTGACTADLKGHLFYVRCNIYDVLLTEYGPEWYEHFHSYHFAWHSSHKNVEWLETYNDTMWPLVHRTFNDDSN